MKLLCGLLALLASRALLAAPSSALPTVRLIRPLDVVEGEASVAALLSALRERSMRVFADSSIDAIVRDSCGAEAQCNPLGLKHVRTLLRMLHVQQHPPKRLCASTRLLVLQFPSSLEGLGSILHTVTVALAEAAYSNRTVVWGLELSPLFDRPRAQWQGTPCNGSAATGHGCPVVHGLPLRCAWGGGGGAFNCFFQALSTCSLADATWEELRTAGDSLRGVDDSGRVRIMSRSKSPAAYAFPRGVLEPEDGSAAPLRHLWAAALAGYAFRLQPAVAAAFERTRKALWPGSPGAEVAGAHVRHGDTTAQNYRNRAVRGFDDAFGALVRQAAAADCETPSPAGGPLPCLNPATDVPDTIFVASDSTELADEFKLELGRDRWRALLRPGRAPPRLVSAADAGGARFLTRFGAHTAAMEEYSCDDGSRASGSCAAFPKLDFASLDAEEVLVSAASVTASGVVVVEPPRDGRSGQRQAPTRTPRPSQALSRGSAAAAPRNSTGIDAEASGRRVLRVMYEAAEDLYLLAHTTRLAATSSSRYGILAALLAWARTGGAAATGGRTVFLDASEVASGALEGSWLQQSFNGSKRCEPPQVRWFVCTAAWTSGLFNGLMQLVLGGAESQAMLGHHVGLRAGPTSAAVARLPVMRQVEFLPTLPPELFWPEAARWARTAGGADPPRRVWGAECPLRPNDPDFDLPTGQQRYDDELQRAAGLDHGAWAHSQQASACFQAAVDAAELDPYVDRASVKALRTTTRTNMDFMELSYLYPFSLPEAELARLARANLDLAAKPVLLEIPHGR